MISKLFEKFFGNKSSKMLKKLSKTVSVINSLRPKMIALSDDELRVKTDEFKLRITNGESLDSILPEAFAVAKEGSRRVTGKEHYDEQIYAGIILHHGMIAEMKTGEGKTLMALLPCYLNALKDTVHVVTANEYLAKRDCVSMGKIYKFLGLSSSYIYNHMDDENRKEAYEADIVHGTSNEFGFDYLRYNGKMSIEDMCQKRSSTLSKSDFDQNKCFNYAVVDEVDNIFIDEARTPLIISGHSEVLVDGNEMSPVDCFKIINEIVKVLSKDFYEIDEKDHSVSLTENGISHIENEFRLRDMLPYNESLYELRNKNLQHYVYQSLKAHYLFNKNTEYVVENNEIVIVDEFTGRKMKGRRYSDGLHQAIEAKEGVKINKETQTMATITLQNYFKLYKKISGMTGTAMTEQAEFREIYGLEVVVIPTHKKMIRKDLDDEIYRTFKEKADAIVKLVLDCRSKNQPVLLGTVSVEKSEKISEIFKQRGIPHNVLNAKNHEKEAEIIANAGLPGSVTIATNMAGRGTDIQLGGNAEMILDQYINELDPTLEDIEIKKNDISKDVEKNKKIVEKAGGLYVIGTERHESRRIDNQLRGRSGRQGDNGCSKFFLSLEDDLMRIFGSEKLDIWLQKLGLKEGEAIIHPWINKSIERAQEKVEARNYSSRKGVVSYDKVMDFERNIVYRLRKEFLSKTDLSVEIIQMISSAIDTLVKNYIPNEISLIEFDFTEFQDHFGSIFSYETTEIKDIVEDGMTLSDLKGKLTTMLIEKFEDFQKSKDAELMNDKYRKLLIEILDKLWRSHLLMTDHLKNSIHLRSYGQKDPVIEYKNESFELFDEMLNLFNFDVVKHIFCEWILNGIEDDNSSDLKNYSDQGDFDLSKLGNMDDIIKNLFGDFFHDFQNKGEKIEEEDIKNKIDIMNSSNLDEDSEVLKNFFNKDIDDSQISLDDNKKDQ